MTEIRLTWDAPEFRQDGTPVGEELVYDIQHYEHEVGNVYATIRRGNDEPITIPIDESGGEHGFRIRTMENGQFSPWTQWVIVNVPHSVGAPGVPLDFTVEIIIT